MLSIFLYLIIILLISSIFSLVLCFFKSSQIKKMPDKSTVLAKDIKMLIWVFVITASILYASLFFSSLFITNDIKDFWESVGNGMNAFGISLLSLLLILISFLFRRFLVKRNLVETNGAFPLFLIISIILLFILPVIFFFKFI